jgi:hypothetical protein
MYCDKCKKKLIPETSKLACVYSPRDKKVLQYSFFVCSDACGDELLYPVTNETDMVVFFIGMVDALWDLRNSGNFPMRDLYGNRHPKRKYANEWEVELKGAEIIIKYSFEDRQGHYEYAIDIDQLKTKDDIVKWVHHLTGKDWVTGEMIKELLEKATSYHAMDIHQ